MESISLAKTPEWRDIDLGTLREEIIPRDRPAVIKGLVKHWPIVRASAQSVPYLRPDRRGMLGTSSPALQGYLRAQLIRALAKRLPRHLREQILHLMTPPRSLSE